MAVSIISSQSPSSRWYVLTLAAITLGLTVGMQQVCMTVLFKEISADLGLNLVEMGMIWGLPALAGFFTVFVGGLLNDRYGAKRVISIACIFVGLAGALRGLAWDFTSLALITFILGLSLWVMPSSVFKITATWFSGRKLVIANGAVSAGMGFGFTVGSLITSTILSPLLGGWGNVLFLYGGISVMIGFLWMLTVREKDLLGSASSGGVPLRQSISRVLPVKSVWLVGLTLLGFAGCTQGMIGYLPTYLRNIGWTVAGADGALATFTAISTLGAVPLALLADRVGLKKVVLFPVLLVTIVGMALVPMVSGAALFVLMIILGVARDGFMAVCLTMSIEAKGVGAVYAGTAMGLAHTIFNIGALVAPPLGNSLADPANPASPLPFFLWAAFGLLALVPFYFIEETGWKRKELPRQ